MPDASPTRNLIGGFGIAVADLDRSAAFYRSTFGMVDVMTFDLPHMQEIVLGFESGKGASLVLMQYTDGSDNSHQGHPLKLVFYVEDPLAVAAAVAAAGLEVPMPPAPMANLGGALVGFVTDPDGHLIEILPR